MNVEKAFMFDVKVINLKNSLYTEEDKKTGERLIKEAIQAKEQLRKLLELRLQVEDEIKSLEQNLSHIERAFPEVLLKGRLGEVSPGDVEAHQKRISEDRE